MKAWHPERTGIIGGGPGGLAAACTFAALGWGLAFGVAAEVPTNAPTHIELPDQFEQPQKISFPTTNLTVLTIADHKGSKQIAGWVEPVAKQFGPRVAVRGIADVSAVPRLLRGTVRAGFRKEQSYPVMMDWSGTVVKQFLPIEDRANILIIDTQGEILRRFVGVAKPAEVQELCQLIEELLAAAPAAAGRPTP